MQSFYIRERLLAVEELPQLLAHVVVQQLRSHHRHEHRAHHDCHTHLVGQQLLNMRFVGFS